MANTELSWTGERLVPSVQGIGVKEHLHRYAFAQTLVKDKFVLDIASGEGYGSSLLAVSAKRVIGVDINEQAINYASEKYKKSNLSYLPGDVKKIPLDDATIDVVVSFETIEHVNEQEDMLNEIKRILKPDGLLIISSPEKANYGDISKEINHFHVKELYLDEFEKLIKRSFINYMFLFQKSVFGTLIIPQSPNSNNFYEFEGDFSNINFYKGLKNPVFNICIASNSTLPEVSFSFFDGQEYYDHSINELQSKISRIVKSKNYRVGKFILNPFRRLKKWMS